MDPSGFDNERFIDCVKNLPELWDVKSVNYQNKIMKKNAWLKVCEDLIDDFSVKTDLEKSKLAEKLMKKWRNMRDNFLRTVRKKTVSGQAAGSRIRYIYGKQMEFLLESGEPSATECSIEADDIDVEETQPEAGPSQELPNIDADDDPIPTRKRSNTPNLSNIPASRRRLMIEENLLKLVSHPVVSPSVSGHDDDDDKNFMLSLVPAMKTLPLDTRLQFRSRVLDLLMQMRLPPNTSSMYQNPSYQFHPHPHTIHPIPSTSHPHPHTTHPIPSTSHPHPHTSHSIPSTSHPHQQPNIYPVAPMPNSPFQGFSYQSTITTPPIPYPSQTQQYLWETNTGAPRSSSVEPRTDDSPH